MTTCGRRWTRFKKSEIARPPTALAAPYGDYGTCAATSARVASGSVNSSHESRGELLRTSAPRPFWELEYSDASRALLQKQEGIFRPRFGSIGGRKIGA